MGNKRGVTGKRGLILIYMLTSTNDIHLGEKWKSILEGSFGSWGSY